MSENSDNFRSNKKTKDIYDTNRGFLRTSNIRRFKRDKLLEVLN